MAYAFTALQDLKECPVCTEEFTDPRALPCDHLLCVDCVNRLKRGSQIKCPVCNEINNASKIRRDFRLMQFLDAIKEEKEDKKKDGEPYCGVCQSASAISWCNDCQQWMCGGCQKTHSNIASCINHSVEPITIKLNEAKAKYALIGKEISDKIQKLKKASLSSEKEVNRLKITQRDAIQKSESIRQKCINEINAYFDSIHAQILSFMEKEMNILERNKHEVDDKIHNMELKWKNCSDLASSNARSLLLHDDFLQELENLEDVIPGANIKPTNFVITITENSSWDASKAAALKMERTEQSGLNITVMEALKAKDIIYIKSTRRFLS